MLVHWMQLLFAAGRRFFPSLELWFKTFHFRILRKFYVPSLELRALRLDISCCLTDYPNAADLYLHTAKFHAILQTGHKVQLSCECERCLLVSF